MAGASNQTATRDEPGGTVVQLIRRIRAWSWLANFGRFKLFAASYVVLIILPLLCALADDYSSPATSQRRSTGPVTSHCPRQNDPGCRDSSRR